MSATIAEPSLIPEALPAVTVPEPSCRKAGFNFANLSIDVSCRINSSLSKTLLSGSVILAISFVKYLFFVHD